MKPLIMRPKQINAKINNHQDRRLSEEFRVIELPIAYEVISERFDGILEMLCDSAIIFGGAIRDIAAGKPLLGDLDVVIDRNQYSALIRKLNDHPRWVRAVETSKDITSYPEEFECPETFENIYGARVQIILPRNPQDRAIDSAKNVDLRCCGLAMLTDGTILEVVEGAFKDCRARELVINPNVEFQASRILKRIAKLKSRGWKSRINIEHIQLKAGADAYEKTASRKLSKEPQTIYEDIDVGENTTITECFREVKRVFKRINMDVDLSDCLSVKLSTLDKVEPAEEQPLEPDATHRPNPPRVRENSYTTMKGCLNSSYPAESSNVYTLTNIDTYDSIIRGSKYYR